MEITVREACLVPKGVERRRSALLTTEDWWAVWLGLGMVLLSLLLYHSGLAWLLKSLAVSPPRWAETNELAGHFAAKWPAYLLLGLGFGAVFTLSCRLMGHPVRDYAPGFAVVFLCSALILVGSASQLAKRYDLEAPLLALILGLAAGNLLRVPAWLDVSLRTEYYIKTGIVLLGATLPLTMILAAGPIAFLQATLVSVITWLTIFAVSTRYFKREPRFGAVLGAAGSVCGISAAIAVGGGHQGQEGVHRHRQRHRHRLGHRDDLLHPRGLARPGAAPGGGRGLGGYLGVR